MDGTSKATAGRLGEVEKFMGGRHGSGWKDTIRAALDDKAGMCTDIVAVTSTEGVQYDGEDFRRYVRMYRMNNGRTEAQENTKKSRHYTVDVSDHQGMEDIPDDIPLESTKTFLASVDQALELQANKRRSGSCGETTNVRPPSTSIILSRRYPNIAAAQRAVEKWQQAGAMHLICHLSAEYYIKWAGTNSAYYPEVLSHILT